MNGTYLKLFVDYLERCQKLSDTEFGRLVRAALQYKANGEEISLPGRESLLWDGMKLDIDRDNEKYTVMAESRSQAGRKGAQTRWQTDGNCHLPDSKNDKAWQTCQDKDKDKDKDKEEDEEKQYMGDKPPKRTVFKPPSIEEVTAYCQERNNGIDAQHFIDYYSAQGWKLSNGVKMTDWKSAVCNWERRNKTDHKAGQGTGNPFAAMLKGGKEC